MHRDVRRGLPVAKANAGAVKIQFVLGNERMRGMVVLPCAPCRSRVVPGAQASQCVRSLQTERSYFGSVFWALVLTFFTLARERVEEPLDRAFIGMLGLFPGLSRPLLSLTF